MCLIRRVMSILYQLYATTWTNAGPILADDIASSASMRQASAEETLSEREIARLVSETVQREQVTVDEHPVPGGESDGHGGGDPGPRRDSGRDGDGDGHPEPGADRDRVPDSVGDRDGGAGQLRIAPSEADATSLL